MAKDGEVEKPFPTEEDIRNHAYEIYLARRGDKRGSDLDDWLAAKAQLRDVVGNRSADAK